MSPNDPHLENLDLAFPHIIDSSCQRAMGVFLFALNYIYRHDRETCTSDRTPGSHNGYTEGSHDQTSPDVEQKRGKRKAIMPINEIQCEQNSIHSPLA